MGAFVLVLGEIMDGRILSMHCFCHPHLCPTVWGIEAQVCRGVQIGSLLEHSHVDLCLP